MMKMTYDNFDNPNAPWSKSKTFRNYNLPTPRDPHINPIKYRQISVDFISLILDDNTVTDFTDCRVRDYTDCLEILTKDNNVITYYHHAIKGYTYKIKPYQPHTDC